jgi:energy-coupling factor transporter transmembrane protein EcfT
VRGRVLVPVGFALAAGALAAALASTSPDALERVTRALGCEIGASPPVALRGLPPALAGAAGVGITMALLTVATRAIGGSASPLDSRLKILLTAGYAVIVSAIPRESAWKLAVLAGVALVASVALRLPIRRWRALQPVAILAALAGTSWMLSDPVDGAMHAALLVSKALLSAHAVVLLAQTTKPAEIRAGLLGLGLPRALVLSISLLDRSLVAMREEAATLARVLEARGASKVRRFSAAATAALFVRTVDRCERVRLSLEARGHDPFRAPSESRRIAGADVAFAGSTALLLALFLCW